MKRFLFPLIAVIAAVSCSTAPEKSSLDYVDPTIGGVGLLLQPTRATVQVPNEFVRWTPDRADLLDDQISSYPLTMVSHRNGSVFGFLPVAGNDPAALWRVRQTYDNENARPYRYSSDLDGCHIEYSPTAKCGIAEVDFCGDEGKWFRFSLMSRDGSYSKVDANTIAGIEKMGNFAVYVVAAFDSEIKEFVSGERGAVLVGFGPGKGKVSMRYGVSLIDKDQAAANLEAEIPAFDLEKVTAACRKAWEDRIGQIDVSGGSERHLRMFYTALYRCCERMVNLTEGDRYYSGFDHQVHKADHPFYADNWLWDTYIALEPLQTILQPEMETNKIKSYIDMYTQCGIMPSFGLPFGISRGMTGNYAAVWMADAWSKGLRFDLETAYEGLKKKSLEVTHIPWRLDPSTPLDKFYEEKGYFPGLQPGEKETEPVVDTRWERRQSVAITTAFSYADWATAQIAGLLGKEQDKADFLRRAAYYRNLYNPDLKLLWPKDSKGNWIEGVDPRYTDRNYYTENNAYTFLWDVKHDLSGLFELMGGREKADENMDEMFRIPLGMSKYKFWNINPDATGMIGQYAVGNEPGFHTPYIYDYTGSPWKTQKWIHKIIDSQFNDSYFGLPGDEDGGGMSAFLVFSMMGYFPVAPGIPVYAIGSPFFETATMHIPNGKDFTVKAENFSEDNRYIQSATLNGKALDRPWFSHEELMAGGVLKLVMGSQPNKAWGSAPEAAPPSSLDYTWPKSE